MFHREKYLKDFRFLTPTHIFLRTLFEDIFPSEIESFDLGKIVCEIWISY